MDLQKHKSAEVGGVNVHQGWKNWRSRYNRAKFAILPGSEFPHGSGRMLDTNSDHKSASVVSCDVSVSRMRIIYVGDLLGPFGLLCGLHVGVEPLWKQFPITQCIQFDVVESAARPTSIDSSPAR
jgi:hypothetical protein